MSSLYVSHVPSRYSSIPINITKNSKEEGASTPTLKQVDKDIELEDLNTEIRNDLIDQYLKSMFVS